MAKRTSVHPPNQLSLRLLMSVEDGRRRLADRIEKGDALRQIPVNSWEDLNASQNQFGKWNSYNVELLKQMFTNEEIAKEYARSFAVFSVAGEQNLSKELKEFHDDVSTKLHRLESISERLELIPLSDGIIAKLESPVTIERLSSNRVFVVHGHDEATREGVARFLERLDLEPVILHEYANQGRTVIEKLERYANVGFVVVLLTPDDEGRSTTEQLPLRPRARQNVLLELGYFTGKLGRSRVCALHKGSLELPSDYLGVLYVPIDGGGGWQLKLAKELRAAGFIIDMNKAI